jgi:hypothetical protein
VVQDGYEENQLLWIGFQGGLVHSALRRTASAASAQRLRAAADGGEADTAASVNPDTGLQAAALRREGDSPDTARDGHNRTTAQRRHPQQRGGRHLLLAADASLCHENCGVRVSGQGTYPVVPHP